MGRFTAPFSVEQQKVLAWIPKMTSVPSILGSSWIVWHVLSRKANRSRVYHRLLCAMSAMDLIWSIKSFASTWPMPEQTRFVYGARGSFSTCAAWGFLGHAASLSSALYNGSLAIYFLLTVAFSWKEHHIRRRGVELLLHVIPVAIGWSTAVVGLPLDLYNPIGWTCWIGTFPPGCGPDTFPCTRSDPAEADRYRWMFFHAELWAVYVLAAITMVFIYRSVRIRERAMLRYVFGSQWHSQMMMNSSSQPSSSYYSSNSNNNSSKLASSPSQFAEEPQQQQQPNTLSSPQNQPTSPSSTALPQPTNTRRSFMMMIMGRNRSTTSTTTTPGTREAALRSSFSPSSSSRESLSGQVAVQAMLYISFFFITWIFPMIQFVVSQGKGDLYFPLLVLTVIFAPLQGFFDALIYLRPRYIKYRKAQKQLQQQQERLRDQEQHGGGAADQQQQQRPRRQHQLRPTLTGDGGNSAVSWHEALVKAIADPGEDPVEGEVYDPDQDPDHILLMQQQQQQQQQEPEQQQQQQQQQPCAVIAE